MNLLYNAGISAYADAVRLAALKSTKACEMLKGQKQTLELVRKGRERLSPSGYDVWVHAASLGEFEQARPMIERLLGRKPDCAVLLTFFSPSGYTVRHNFNERVQVAYLPFDLPGRVSEFLDAACPKMAVFVKYEFWGNYLEQLRQRGIRTYIISAIFRPGQIFFRPWGGMFRGMLACFDHIYVQDEASRKLLAGIGVDNVTVAGDTRFDRVAEVRKTTFRHPVVDAFLNVSGAERQPCIVIGSSWPGDEDIYIPWLTARTGVKAIIAPHEFDAERIKNLCSRLGGGAVPLSGITSDKDSRIGSVKYLIVDCFGMLSSLYRVADFAYVGGGFGVGLHNINEAATFGIPVVYGPNNRKFREAAELKACGGGFCIRSRAEFAAVADRLIADKDFWADAGKKAGAYIESHIGATDIIMKDLFEY